MSMRKTRLMNNAIILLSGGLDSLVSLSFVKSNTDYDIKLALTIDYGQKTAEAEITASKEICKFYNIEHKVITLDWLKSITKTALVSAEDVPKEGFSTKKSAEAVWVPNRNALFLNIAACYCETYDLDYIIYGANKEESKAFSDNDKDFISLRYQNYLKLQH